MLRPSFFHALTLRIAAAPLVLLSSQTGRATNLAEYDFAGYATSDSGSAVTTTAAMLTATNFAPNAAGFQAFSPGSMASNYMFTTNNTTAFGYQSQTNPATEALAVTNTTYYTFTLAPAAGRSLSFNTAGGVDTLTPA